MEAQEGINKFQSDKYIIYENIKLGSGGFGQVYAGRNRQTNNQVAIKIIFLSNLSNNQLSSQFFQQISSFHKMNLAQNQISINQKISHQNVMKIDGTQFKNNFCYIGFQKCDYTLEQLISRKNQAKIRFSEDQCNFLVLQICKAFEQLNKNKIRHRDLKPDNIMLKAGILKVGDFGVAKQVENSQKSMRTGCGTPHYLPLQVLNKQKYDQKSDVWALGCVFYKLLHGQLPWRKYFQKYGLHKLEHLLAKFLQEEYDIEIYRSNLSQETKKFINCCLKVDADQRLSWKQLFVQNKQFFEKYDELKSRLNQFRNGFDLLFNQQESHVDFTSILSSSNIVTTKQQCSKIVKFFDRKVQQMNIVFKANNYGFELKKFFQNCGELRNILIIMKTKKNKIIGGFTPLELGQKQNQIYQKGSRSKFIADSTGESFTFSLTNNDKFRLKNKEKALKKWKGNKFIQFGNEQMKICNKSNTNKSCLTLNINQTYQNQNYNLPQSQQCEKLNGNGNQFQYPQQFMTKQWQAWQISFEQFSPIISKESQCRQLLGFFDSPIQTKLLFKASAENFSMEQYYLKCGNQADTLIIAKTTNSKIIGGYTPLSFNPAINQIQYNYQYQEDSTGSSFIFSLTNGEQNGKFKLKNKEKAIKCDRTKEWIIFGLDQLRIRDGGNFNGQCCQGGSVNINYHFFNQNYEDIKDSTNGQIKFNGNQQRQFILQDWQVWKITFASEQGSFNFTNSDNGGNSWNEYWRNLWSEQSIKLSGGKRKGVNYSKSSVPDVKPRKKKEMQQK